MSAAPAPLGADALEEEKPPPQMSLTQTALRFTHVP
jgi:hypothetical protein